MGKKRWLIPLENGDAALVSTTSEHRVKVGLESNGGPLPEMTPREAVEVGLAITEASKIAGSALARDLDKTPTMKPKGSGE